MAAMCAVLLVFFLPPSFIAQAATRFIFNQFNSSNSTIDLFGNASMQSNGAISLTKPSQNSIGRAFYKQSVRMKDNGSMDSTLSFSTTFVFSIVPSSTSQSGHGLAFVMTPYLGLLNSSSSIDPFAVEFDTVMNLEVQEINDNHVGVDHKNAGYWINNTQFQDLDIKNGHNIQAWIDYDHLANELNVTIVQAGSRRPQKPLIYMRNISLSNIFEKEMHVGFSAATSSGGSFEENYIMAWSFSTDGSAPVLNTSHLPTFVRTHSKTTNSLLIAGVTTACFLLFLVVVAASLVLLKRHKHRDVIEEWEMEYWPHRFNYKDLHIATNGFRDEGLLGSGGFGRVYRGALPTNGLEVAVKCILRETNEGVKEFIAEISSLGRLQHRNLVKIRGYCKRGTQLFIVYDYMPNGSLEKMIFGKPKTVLGWAQRYRIVRDVAAGLLYLHEGWDQTVVHRDIKSSNVLLDSELNAKLGDFGLARLYEHNKNSETTRVMGTLGYMAPELINTGKATPATDVFSFGIFLLEVACGRRPVDPSLDAAQMVMVDWVRELYDNDNLMDAADPYLGCGYIADEMERVLKLGLLCSNPQPEGRLGMRQVLQILEEESPIPGFDPLFYSKMNVQTNTGMSASFSSRSTDASTSMSLEAR